MAGTNLFLLGGADIWNNCHRLTVDSYDPTTDQWHLDRSTYRLTAAYIATASLGGQIYCSGRMDYNAFPYAASYRYDAGSGVFTPLPNGFLYPPAPLPQQGFGVAQVGNVFYLIGADNPKTGLVQRFQP